MQSGQILLIASGIVAIVVVVALIRLRRLREAYSIALLGAIVIFVVTATWGFGTVIWITQRLGVTYAPSGVFALGFGVVAIVGVYFGVVVTGLQDKLKALAQENALLEARLRRVESQAQAKHRDGDSDTADR